MNMEESFLQKLRQLPPDKQREAIDFVEFLHRKNPCSKQPRRSIKGLWANLGLEISEQDITAARAECWGKFPHEDI